MCLQFPTCITPSTIAHCQPDKKAKYPRSKKKSRRNVQIWHSDGFSSYREFSAGLFLRLSQWCSSTSRSDVCRVEGACRPEREIYRQVLPRLRDEQIVWNVKAEIVADALNNFAYLRRTQGDSREAETLFREALALNPQMPTDEANFTNGVTQSVLASTLADQGRFDEALQTSREGVAEQRRHGFTKTPTFGFNLTVLSGFLTEKG